MDNGAAFLNILSLKPKSLFSRILLTLLSAVGLSLILSYLVWSQQIESGNQKLAKELSAVMAESIASTTKFFRALPSEYRHLVLSQLREVGGTRYFVSVNKEFIHIKDVEPSSIKYIIQETFIDKMRSILGPQFEVYVAFSKPENLHVFNNQTLLLDLPARWAQHSLIYDPLSPPILVAQLKMDNGEWLYVAGLFAKPDLLETSEYLSKDRVQFLFTLLAVLAVVVATLVKRISDPLKRLAQAADELGKDIDRPPLVVEGPQEIQATASAFNHMQERIKRFIEDRERMFSAISHDLKTPITRLRLRSEFVEDKSLRNRFTEDLDELNQMVAGALACLKDTDIHEPTSEVNIRSMLDGIAAGHVETGARVEIEGHCGCIMGKPQALRRCFANLVDNAVFYGDAALIEILDSEHMLLVRIRDHGQGLPSHELNRVFAPYYRLEASRNRNIGGNGLGLSISRQIAIAHGGDITLMNHGSGGLVAEVVLPRQ